MGKAVFDVTVGACRSCLVRHPHSSSVLIPTGKVPVEHPGRNKRCQKEQNRKDPGPQHTAQRRFHGKRTVHRASSFRCRLRQLHQARASPRTDAAYAMLIPIKVTSPRSILVTFLILPTHALLELSDIACLLRLVLARYRAKLGVHHPVDDTGTENGTQYQP